MLYMNVYVLSSRAKASSSHRTVATAVRTRVLFMLSLSTPLSDHVMPTHQSTRATWRSYQLAGRGRDFNPFIRSRHWPNRPSPQSGSTNTQPSRSELELQIPFIYFQTLKSNGLTSNQIFS